MVAKVRGQLDTDELKTIFSASDIGLIRQSVVRAAEQPAKILAVDDVNIHFSVGKSIREWWGVGAYAPDTSTICMFTHPDIFRLHEAEGYERFSAVVAHELQSEQWPPGKSPDREGAAGN